MFSVHYFTFGPFEENTYILFDETREAVVIDPGCSNRSEEAELKEFIDAEKLTIKFLLNTHCHVDHVLGNAFVKDTYRVPFLMHRLDQATLRSAIVLAPMYGVHNYREATPDRFVEEGEEISFGSQKLKVLFLPGHAPGHIGFYNEKEKVVIGGDVLFQHSIGRTDLPGGNHDVLINSIHQKLFTLPDDVVVYPGHGAETTIGEEKIHNPFCALSLR